MQFSSMHYFPLALPFLLALAVLFLILTALVELSILTFAYEQMGIPSRHVVGVLLLSLLGSAINLPIAELPPEAVVSGRLVTFYGMRYVVPVVQEWPGTVLAINVGGALIPFILSLYLMVKNKTYVQSLLAVALVVPVVHTLSQPVSGVGISVPVFIPPIVAAGAALLVGRRQAASLAYTAGSLGTLIGADLMNLGKIQGLGAPVASIGGAGTFDGVFLCGIIAVLLASMAQPRVVQRHREGEGSGPDPV